MIFTEWLTAGFLVIGILGFAVTSIGLVASRDLYDQIHYLAPGTLVGATFFGLAVLAHEGFTQPGVKALLIVLLLLLSNPLLSHATARAGRIRRSQKLRPGSAHETDDGTELE